MFKSLIIYLVNLFILQQWILSAVAQSLTQPCIDEKKLCFGYPSNCPSSSTFDCDILVLISAKFDGLDVDMYGVGSPGSYFALGFVNEPGMSGSTVVHCDYQDYSNLAVGEGYTVGYSLRSLPTGTLTKSRSAGLENGIVHCSWTQKAKGQAGDSGINYDVNNLYFVQLAMGKISNGALQHHSVRSITDTTVNLTSLGIVETSKTIPLAIRVHGSLMTIAWLGLVSIAMMIARYHKNSWGETTMCNVRVWFALHRGLMLSALTSAIIGMVTIFIHAGGWRANSLHQYLGVTANILMVLQPIGALLRPAPDHENRIFFNILHSFGGYIGHTLALLTLFFVAKLSITLSKAYFILLIVFVVVYFSAHLILQFHPHLLATLNLIDSTDMTELQDVNNASSDQSSPNPVLETIERSKKRVLTLFILLVIIIAISLIVFVNLGSP